MKSRIFFIVIFITCFTECLNAGFLVGAWAKKYVLYRPISISLLDSFGNETEKRTVGELENEGPLAPITIWFTNNKPYKVLLYDKSEEDLLLKSSTNDKIVYKSEKTGLIFEFDKSYSKVVLSSFCELAGGYSITYCDKKVFDSFVNRLQ